MVSLVFIYLGRYFFVIKFLFKEGYNFTLIKVHINLS